MHRQSSILASPYVCVMVGVTLLLCLLGVFVSYDLDSPPVSLRCKRTTVHLFGGVVPPAGGTVATANTTPPSHSVLTALPPEIPILQLSCVRIC